MMQRLIESYLGLSCINHRPGQFISTLLVVATFLCGPLLPTASAQLQPGEFIDAFISSKVPTRLGDIAISSDGHLYMTSSTKDSVLRYDLATGELLDPFVQEINLPPGQTFIEPTELVLGPDGHLYVSSYHQRLVYRYNRATGAFIDLFVADSTDYFTFTSDLEFGPDGHLYLLERHSDSVFRYDGTSGAIIDTFVVAENETLMDPQAIEFGPNGNLYITSTSSEIQRYDGTTGEFIDTFITQFRGGLVNPQDLFFGPENTLYITSEGSNEILRFDSETGEFIDVFEPHDGRVSRPRIMGSDVENRLYVINSSQVFRYDLSDGAFIDALFSPQDGGLNTPFHMSIGPDDLLYVTHANNELLRFDMSTGAFVDTFITSNSGGLVGPSGLAFGPDNNLYISSFSGDEVLRYNGSTGEFIDIFIPYQSGGLDAPRELEFRPDDMLYVISSMTNEILRYDASSGEFVDTFISTDSSDLTSPISMVFTEEEYVYISSSGYDQNDILRYNGNTGEFVDIVATLPTSRFNTRSSQLRSLTIGPYGDLYVARRESNEIFRINLSDSAIPEVFIESGAEGLRWPGDIIFGPDNNAYVSSSSSDEILRFQGPNPTQTDIREEQRVIQKLLTHTLYPNPVKNTATLSYVLDRPTDVRIDIFDITGRHVQQLASKSQSPGAYSLSFDAHHLPSGNYFYFIRANNFQDTGRFVRVK